MSTTYENTRRHARALETALEAKLATYSKIASGIASSSSSGGGGGAGGGGSGSGSGNRDMYSLEEEGIGGYKLVEEEVEELLEKVSHHTIPCPCALPQLEF
jgi:golgi SNAP receptor complex member 1